MAQIRHIAIQTQDEDATAHFYMENFGLKLVRKLDSDRTSGYFLTEDLEEMTDKLAQSGAAKPRDDINVALGLGAGGAPAGHGNVEVRYAGPDNVNFDVSETGWVGTPTNKVKVPA
jgi:catechol 2,3-dioxygenase-like lactoylglutathione lyase family enzyme